MDGMVRCIFRADASNVIGTGHVMRCATLAKQLKDKGANVEFITRTHEGNINKYLSDMGFIVHGLKSKMNTSIKVQSVEEVDYLDWLGETQENDAKSTIDIIGSTKADLLIVDHYSLDRVWEGRLRPHVKKILAIDDLANRHHDCDILLDHNYNDYCRYNHLVSPSTTKLIGPAYALLRKEFASKIRQNKEIENVRRILIFFGGADPLNLTGKTLKVIMKSDLRHVFLDVVVGQSNPHREQISELCKKLTNATFHFQVDNIGELMFRADLAIGAGGVTALERIATSLPSIVITIADNQVPSTEKLHTNGYVHWLGTSKEVVDNDIHDALGDFARNPAKLNAIVRKGKQLISPNGAKTVANFLLEGPKIATLTVRDARLADSSIYWHWVNDIEVRKSSFEPAPITWEDHQKWFKTQLTNPDAILLVIVCEFGPLGQVRLNKSEHSYVLDYSLGNQYRGYGLASEMLKLALAHYSKSYSHNVLAKVKRSNHKSIKVLKRTGFTENLITEKDDSIDLELKMPFQNLIE